MSYCGWFSPNDLQREYHEEWGTPLHEACLGKKVRRSGVTQSNDATFTPTCNFLPEKLHHLHCINFDSLMDEKYRGDALLRKQFTVDYPGKTVKKNEGKVPQFYVENHHPAVISPDTFDLAQIEIERRSKIGGVQRQGHFLREDQMRRMWRMVQPENLAFE